MRAWLFQDHRQRKKHGAKAPWSVGWVDPEGRRRSKRIGSKSMAGKFARKIEGQLAAGTYHGESRKKWADFRAEYEAKIAERMDPRTRDIVLGALGHFERIARPQRMDAIGTKTIDAYVAQRRTEPGVKKGSRVSPATINKELRHLKAVLRKAHKWGCLRKLPDIEMLREPKKLVRYVTPEHFAAIYGACDVATMPKGLPYPASGWWRAFLTFQYMTGWRMGEPLALRREDFDLDAGTAITRCDDNKGRRDEQMPLHPVVVEHLRKIASFEPVVFPWPHNMRSVWDQFHRIQEAAGIHLLCRGRHEHTAACHLYGFHDLRRAFATMNASRLSGNTLQTLMRHKSYTTTQRYINMAQQLEGVVEALHVPDVLRATANA